VQVAQVERAAGDQVEERGRVDAEALGQRRRLGGAVGHGRLPAHVLILPGIAIFNSSLAARASPG
jgi:hypothetical protein